MRTIGLWSCGVLLLAALAALPGCGNTDEAANSAAIIAAGGTIDAPVELGKKPKVVVPPGAPPDELVVTDLRKGTGPVAEPGPYLTVQFVALRWNGEPFQSSWDNDQFQTFSFKLHRSLHQVNPAWEQGVPGMRVGGRREIVAPPRYLSAEKLPPEYLEPRDTIVYVVELLGIDK